MAMGGSGSRTKPPVITGMVRCMYAMFIFSMFAADKGSYTMWGGWAAPPLPPAVRREVNFTKHHIYTRQ